MPDLTRPVRQFWTACAALRPRMSSFVVLFDRDIPVIDEPVKSAAEPLAVPGRRALPQGFFVALGLRGRLLQVLAATHRTILPAPERGARQFWHVAASGGLLVDFALQLG